MAHIENDQNNQSIYPDFSNGQKEQVSETPKISNTKNPKSSKLDSHKTQPKSPLHSHLDSKQYHKPLPVQSKTFRQKITMDRQAFSHKKPQLSQNISESESPYYLQQNNHRLSTPLSYKSPHPSQTKVFRKSHTNANNYINIQNDLESNWNFKTKSEAVRPSYAVSIDPEKMNIRGYLQEHKGLSDEIPQQSVMGIVEHLLNSEIIHTLIEIESNGVPFGPINTRNVRFSQRKNNADKQAQHKFRTYDNWNFGKQSNTENKVISEEINSPFEVISHSKDRDGPNSESSFREITPAKNMFWKEEVEVKKWKGDKKSCVSSNISFGFMKKK